MVVAYQTIHPKNVKLATDLCAARVAKYKYIDCLSISIIITMSTVSWLEPIEKRFAEENAVKWMDDHWLLSVYASVIYVVLVHAGRHWMHDKLAWSLRKPLVMWNASLAAFSTLGTLTLLPPMVSALLEEGLAYSVCHRIVSGTTSHHRNLWSFLFVVFKMVELGDTAFIVLRKTPLNFLHWYHHITVMMYSWSFYSMRPGVANWFILLNFFVHSVMYTYYVVRACGYKLSHKIMQLVTCLQLSQFVVGILANLFAFRLQISGEPCGITEPAFYIGLAMYGSYFVLFANFFYQRYCAKK